MLNPKPSFRKESKVIIYNLNLILFGYTGYGNILRNIKAILKNVIKREYNPFSGENKNKYNTFDREKHRKKIYKATKFENKPSKINPSISIITQRARF